MLGNWEPIPTNRITLDRLQCQAPNLWHGCRGLWLPCLHYGRNVLPNLSGYGRRLNGAVSSPSTIAASPLGQAAEFNGTSTVITVSNAQPLEVTRLTVFGIFTINGSLTSRELIYRANDSSPTGWGVGVSDGVANKLKFYTATSGGAGQNLESSTTLTSNQWYAVTYVYNPQTSGTNKFIYVDGKVDGSASHTNTLGYSGTLATLIGGYASGQRWNGKMAFIGVWDRPFAPQEVYQLTADPLAMVRSPRTIVTKSAATYNQIATGGAVAAGSATNNIIASNTATGGALAAGAATFSVFNETGNGGVVVSGSPININGPFYANTIINNSGYGTAGVAWIFPANATISDNSYAFIDNELEGESGNNITNYLQATGFGFSIPASSVITGIRVQIEKRQGSSSCIDDTVKLVVGGIVSGSNKAVGGQWNTSDTTTNYGSDSDLWGLSLTHSDVNSNDFGIVLAAAIDGSNFAYVDSIFVAVYYTLTLDQIGYGGLQTGGTATTDASIYNINASGGIVAAGDGIISTSSARTSTGGTVVAGSALSVVSIFASGGTIAGRGLTGNTSSTMTPSSFSNDTAVGTADWVDASNAGASDNAYATVSTINETTYYLKGLNLGFSTTGTITGIVLTVERRGTGGGDGIVKDSSIRLVKNGSFSGNNKSTGTTWATSDETVTFGNSSDLWGLTWTTADINATNFGVGVSAEILFSQTASIDLMTLTVYYNLPPDTSVTYNPEHSGGTVVGGSATVQHKIYGSGGTVAGGSAFSEVGLFGSGGVVVSSPSGSVPVTSIPTVFSNDATIGVGAWVNPSNAGASDNSYASFEAGIIKTTQYLKGLTAGFTIPSGSTINGIQLDIEKKLGFAGEGTKDNSVKLVKGGTFQGDDKKNASIWSTSDTVVTYGGAADLWGLSWTVSNINASDFGAGISATAPIIGESAHVDVMTLTVYYTPPPYYYVIYNPEHSGGTVANSTAASSTFVNGSGGVLVAGSGVDTVRSTKTATGGVVVGGSATDSIGSSNVGTGGVVAGSPIRTQTANPNTAADDASIGVNPWSDPDNAKTSNNAYATTSIGGGANSHYLKLTNFGFTSTDPIQGIEVSIERNGTIIETGISDYSVRLVKAGLVVGSDKADTVTIWPTSDTVKTYGGSTDLWGTTWSSAQINAVDFGIVIAVASINAETSDLASIDAVSITIYYAPSDVYVIYNPEHSGGVVAGGSATISESTGVTATGGVIVAGPTLAAPIAFDAASNYGGHTISDISWVHTPVGTPRGVVVQIVQTLVSTDDIASVTYGGVAMSRVAGATVFHDNGLNSSAVYTYFLGSGIPTGAKTILATLTGEAGGVGRTAAACSVTASSDVEVNAVNTSTSASVTNPSVVLSTNTDCFVVGALHSGHNDPSSIAPGTNYTDIYEDDFSSRCASFIRRTAIASSGSITVDWVAAAQGAAIGAVAINAIVSTSSPVPVYVIYNPEHSGGVVTGGTGLDEVIISGSGGVVVGGSATDNVVVYHPPANETGFGGVVVGGSATDNVIISEITTGGVVVGGEVELTGGVVIGGSATDNVRSSEIATGGVVIGGSATDNVRSSEIATGGVVVGGSATSNIFVYATGGVVVGGSATNSVRSSEIATGGVVVGGTATNSVRSSEIATGGVVVGGTATNSVRSSEIATGGVVVGGSATDNVRSSEIATGGVVANSSDIDSGYPSEIATGGVVVGGSATSSIFIYTTGGVVVGGSATDNVISSETATGGVVVGGSATDNVRSSEIATGGVVVNGTSLDTIIAIETAAGGVVVGGLGTVALYNTQFPTGGVVANSSDIDSGYPSEIATGGVVVGGSATDNVRSSEIATGGVVANSTSAVVSVDTTATTGGVVVGGSGIDTVRYTQFPAGGVVVAGGATDNVRSSEIATGGVVVNGSATSNILVYATGGVVVGGTSLNTIIAIEISAGGVVTGGDSEIDTASPTSGNGGVVVNGSAIDNVISSEIATGGVVVNGSDIDNVRSSEIATGGVVVNGSAASNILVYATGGVVVNGSAASDILVFVTGGVVVGGSGINNVGSSEIATGGVVVNGSATSNILVYATGGVVVDGESIDTIVIYVPPIDETTFGGVVIGGNAVNSVISVETGRGGVVVDGTPRSSIFIYATGGVVVGGSSLSEIIIFGTGGVVVDGSDIDGTSFSNILALGGVVAGGSATSSIFIYATGGVVVNGSDIDGIVFPAILAEGGVVVNGSGVDNVRLSQTAAGGIVVGGSGIDTIIAAELATGGVVVGGSASSSIFNYATGGVVVGGSDVDSVRSFEISIGGVVVNSSALSSIFIYATGGVVVNGSDVDTGYASEITTGGVVVGGSGIDTIIAIETATGGVVVGGSALSSIFNYATGGVVVNGSDVDTVVFSDVPPTGGVVVDGESHVDTTSPSSSNGGVVVGGSGADNAASSEVATGGVVVGGSEVNTIIAAEIGTGGVVVGGSASSSIFIYATGGVVVGGESPSEVIIFGLGGVVVNGSDIDTIVIYIPPIDETTFGGVVVGGTSDNNKQVDIVSEGGVVVGGIVIYYIATNDYGIGGVVVGGDSTFINNINASGGVVVGGTSTLAAVYDINASGGVVVDGSTIDNQETPTINASGGVVVGGTSTLTAVYNINASGGVVVGGSTDDNNNHTVEEISVGGVVVGGTSVINLIVNIDSVGGVVVGGTSLFRYDEVSIGGVVVNGSISSNQNSQNIATGGVVVGGNGVDAANISGIGGVVVGGHSHIGYEEIASGGVVVNGNTSGTSGVVHNITSSGGVVVNGSITIFVIYRVRAVGGVVVNGTSNYYLLFQFVIGGGVVVNGAGVDTTAVVSIGGVVVDGDSGGTGTTVVTYSVIAIGGVVVDGNSPVEGGTPLIPEEPTAPTRKAEFGLLGTEKLIGPNIICASEVILDVSGFALVHLPRLKGVVSDYIISAVSTNVIAASASACAATINFGLVDTEIVFHGQGDDIIYFAIVKKGLAP